MRRGKRKKVGGALVKIKDDGAVALGNSVPIVATELTVCLRRPFCPKEACRCDVRSLAQCLEFRPHHVFGDPFPAYERTKPAIYARDNPFPITNCRYYRLNPLGDDLRMLNHVAL